MDKYALVTGADHGLGYELVKKLLEREYIVYAGRLKEEEQMLDKLAESFSGKLTIFKLDIGSDASVKAMKELLENAVPCLDLVINNAGILGDIKKNIYDELDFEEIQRVINVNAVGTLRVTNSVIPLVMESRQKLIVNISSEAGSISQCEREGWFAYCMSKTAGNMQSALVHNNIRKRGGKVVVIQPGHMATYMRGHLDTTAAFTPEESAKGILEQVLDRVLPETERPSFIDNEGNPLAW